MIIISLLALLANVVSLYILQKSKSNEVHIKASMICTSNDVIANAGVITAGVLVLLLHSNIPDLVVGTIVFTMVLRGSIKILQLGNK
jgi:Co/Zn/Cd efflux system component